MARAIGGSIALLLLSAPAGSQCRIQPATAPFVVATGGALEPGPSPNCAYHLHRLACGPASINASTSITIQPATGAPAPVVKLSATPPNNPAGILFGGTGGPASLRVEYAITDVPQGFTADRLRAYVSCLKTSDTPYCMTDYDPAWDLGARTASTRVDALPRRAGPFVTISHIDTPADGTFTTAPTIDVGGHFDLFNILGGSTQSTGFLVELERKDEGGQKLSWGFQGASPSWSQTGVSLGENANRITAWVRDPSSDRSFERIVVVRDTVAPVVTLSGIAPDAQVTGPVTLSATETERWPGTHVVNGSRKLRAFLGEPAVDVPVGFTDPDLTLVSETPPSVRTLALPTLVAEGDYSLTLLATDRAGNAGQAAIGFTIDTTAPIASIAGVAAASISRLTQVPSIRVTDRNLLVAAIGATLDGVIDPDFVCGDTDLDPGIVACSGRAAKEGAYVVTASGTDQAGNVSAPAAVSFVIDRTRPEVSFTGAGEGEFKTAAFTIAASIADPHRDSAMEGATLARDGVVVATRSGPDLSFAIEQEGDYRLAVTATDLAGNTRTAERRFGLDLHPPIVAIDYPLAGSFFSEAEIAVRGSVEERFLESVIVAPGARPAAASAGSWLLPALGLAPGDNLISVTATDRAGRTGTATVTVHHDGLAPVVTIAVPASGLVTNRRAVHVSATASDDNLDEVSLNGEVLAHLGGSPVPYAVERDLRLGEGANELVVEARDRAGSSARTAVQVTLDTRCDQLIVLAPGNGHRTRESEVVFTGSARDAQGITVTVAGVAATFAGDTFTAAVPLADGDNAIDTVGLDGAGNECRSTTRVFVDRTGPALVDFTPGDGAAGIDLAEPLVLSLSEDIRLNGGLAVSAPGVATVSGSRVVYRPESGWPSDATVTVELASAVTDKLGNPLTNPRSWTFHTVDRTGPAAPVLDPLPDVTSAISIPVCGHAEAGTKVRIEGGTAPVESGWLGADGQFCLDLGLEKDVLNQVLATAGDPAGNVSPPAVDYVRQETVRPVVATATVAGSPPAIRLVFTKDMDCATIVPGTVLIEDGSQPRSLAISNCEGTTASVSSTEVDLAVDPFLLTVTTEARDTLGNPLAFRYSKLFNSNGLGFLTGEVYDAATGLRLAGATIETVSVDDRPPAAPAPRTTSDPKGGFQLGVTEAGLTWMRAARTGYTEVWRQAASQAGLAVPVFDFRLSPIALDEIVLPPAGGTVRGADGAVLLTVPGDSSPDRRLRMTPLAAQGLPLRLPAGWSPVYAIDLRPALDFASPATLRVPNHQRLVPGDDVQLVRFDEGAHDWIVGLPPSVASDGQTLVASIDRTGSYALLVADRSPEAPPRPVVAAALPGVPHDRVQVGSDLGADMRMAPDSIFPAGQAVAELELRHRGETTSGLALQADVAERLRLLDDAEVELKTYIADLTLFHDGARFPVKPQPAPGFDLYKEGHVRVKVFEFPADVPQGGVIDRNGGQFHRGNDPWHLVVPADAVEAPTPVMLLPRGPGELPLPALPSFELQAAIDLSLGGARLGKGAQFLLDLAEPPPGSRFVLLRVAESFGRQRWAYVAPALYESGQLRSTGGDPGVREEGIHAFFRLGVPFGWLDGHVHDTEPAGAAVDGALVETIGDWPIGLTYDGGKIATVAAVGATVRVDAESPVTRDRGAVETNVTDGETSTVEVYLQPTPPVVVLTDPPPGASNVRLGTSITIVFSEAVRPWTLQSGIVVTAVGSPVPGTVLAVLGGTRAIFDPIADLPPNREITVDVLSGITDLSGHGCEGNPCHRLQFRTLDTIPPNLPPSGSVRVFAPNAGGAICVEAPAMAGVVSVAVTNLASNASTTLRWDPGRGDYRGCILGSYGQLVRVTYLDDAGNATSEDHDLFLEPDSPAPAARVGPGGGSFAASDADGTIEIAIPPGAFADSTLVTLDPQPVAGLDLGADAPAAFSILGAFDLRLEGKEAAADLVLRLDPGDATPEDPVLLARVIEVGGRRLPEFVAQLELVDGKLVTRVPALTLETGPTELGAKAVRAPASGPPAANADPEAIQPVPGARREGTYGVFKSTSADIAFLTLYASQGGLVGVMAGGAGWGDWAYMLYDLWERPMVFPVQANLTFHVDLFDAATGQSVYSKEYPPIPRNHGASDKDPKEGQGALWVTGATPSKSYYFRVSRQHEQFGRIAVQSLAPDSDHDGIPDTGELEIRVTGETGAVAPQAHVRVQDAETGDHAGVDAEADGSFAIAALPVAIGQHVILTVETAAVDPASQPITLQLNRPVLSENLAKGLQLLEDGIFPRPVRVEGNGTQVKVIPVSQLLYGKRYLLRLTSDAMPGPFESRFHTRPAVPQATFEMDDPNEMVKVGGVLFVAAGDEGLKVIDVSHPDQPAILGQAQMAGKARGIAAFHADPGPPATGLRLALCGGGDRSMGWIRIFDVSTLARLQQPAILGGEVASNRLGATDLETYANLGPGVPLRVRTFRLFNPGATPPAATELAFVAVNGIGLEIFDISRMGAEVPQPPAGPTTIVGTHAATEVVDVALLGRTPPLGHRQGLTSWPLTLQHMTHELTGAGIKATALASDSPPDDVPDDPIFPVRIALGPEPRRAAALVSAVDSKSGGAVHDVRAADDGSLTVDLPGVSVGDPLTITVEQGLELLAVLARGTRGIEVVDVLDPRKPTHLGTLPLPGTSRAVAIFPSFPLRQGAETVATDLAFVSIQEGSVAIVDLTVKEQPRFRGMIALGGQVLDLALDTKNSRALISKGSEGLVVIDISDPLNPETDPNRRVLARIPANGGRFNTGLATDFDLGTIYAASEGEGVASIRLEVPRPRFVTEAPTGEVTAWGEIVPLGIPAPSSPHTSQARVSLALPGGSGPEVYAAVAPETAYGAPMRNPKWKKGSVEILGKIDLLKLKRQSNEILESRYNLYVSEDEVAFTADPGQVDATRPTVVAGDGLGLRLVPPASCPAGFTGDLDWMKPWELPQVAAVVPSFRMDLVPGDKPAPPTGASTGQGDVLGVFLHSGEFFWGETDLGVEGRSFGFSWSRNTRSQAKYNGPLGRRWDSPYLARVRELPTGDVEYYPGTAERRVFAKLAAARPSGVWYDPPVGLNLRLDYRSDHFEITTPDGVTSSFNPQGDLVAIEDNHGNRVELVHDQQGRLETVRDEMGRYSSVDWDDQGRIHKVTDFAGRTVEYTYDAAAKDELVQRKLFGHYTVEYGYDAAEASQHALRSLKDETGTSWLVNTYVAGKVTEQQWGKADEKVQVTSGETATVVDRRGNTTAYLHDLSGRLLQASQSTPSGNAVTALEWDDLARLKRVTQPEQDQVEYEYRENKAKDPLRDGDVSRVKKLPRPSDGGETETVQLEYLDSMSRVKSLTDERGKVTTFQRNRHGDIEEIHAPRGAVTTFRYNNHGQLVETKDPEGLVVRREYYPETMPGGSTNTLPDAGLDATTGGYLRTITVDPEGEGLKLKTEHRYDTLGRLRETTNPAGGKLGFEYDDRGLVTKESRKRAAERYEVNHTYDDRGLPDLTTYQHSGVGGLVTVDEDHDDPLGFRTKETVKGPGLPEAGVVTSFTPDPNRNLAEVIHPLGWKEVFTYDARELLEKTERKVGDVVYSTVKRTYDLNRLLTSASSRRDAAWKTEIQYDGHDRIQRLTEPGGLIRKREYYPGGLPKYLTEVVLVDDSEHPDEKREEIQRWTKWKYDDLGFLTSLEKGVEPDRLSALAITLYTPDRLGRNTQVTDPRNKSWSYQYFPTGWLKQATDPLQNATDYTYHPLGDWATRTADGVTTTRTYDAFGRLTAEADPGGHRQTVAYDSRDNRIESVDTLRASRTWRYDALDRVLGEDGPNGEKVTRTWDDEGHLLTYQDANGNLTSWGYDELGRMQSATYPGPTTTTYTYNAADLVETETTPRSFHVASTYDKDDRLLGREVKDVGGAVVDSETLGYDALGRLSLADNATATVTRVNDPFDNVKEETVEIKGVAQPAGKRTVTRTFLAGLLLQTLTYPVSGRTLTYGPDDAGRLTSVLSGADSMVEYGFEGPVRLKDKTILGSLSSQYGYEPGEQTLSSITRSSAGKGVFDWGVAWTARHEVDIETDHKRRSVKNDFDYDGAGRLTDAAYPERTLTYDIDPVRNIKERLEKLGGTYARSEQATLLDNDGNRYQSYAGQNLAYDAEGNLNTTGKGDSYTYDWRGRLAEAFTDAGHLRYAYDAFGRKLKREVVGGSTELLWYDGWELVEATDLSGTPTYEVVNGGSVDEPLVYWDGAGNERRLFQDRLGSVAGVTDSQGKVLEAWRYDAYGRARRYGVEHIDHVRFQSDGLVVRFTGEIEMDKDHLQITPALDGAWTLSEDGRELRFEAEDKNNDGQPDWPSAELTLQVDKGLRSVFGVEIGESRQVTWDATDRANRVLADWVAPTVECVTQEPNDEVHVHFSEAIDPASLGSAFTLRELASNQPMDHVESISPTDPRTVVIDANATLSPAMEYALELDAGKVKDVSGATAAAASYKWKVEFEQTLVWDRGDTKPADFSTTGNRLGFMGRPLDPATGWWDFRARHLDSRLGRFTQPDPAGHSDMNLYAAFAGDPVNHIDPMGTDALEINVSASGESRPSRMLDEDEFLARLYQTGAQGGEFDQAVWNAGYSGDRLRFHREFARGLAPAFALYNAADETVGNYLYYWKGVGLAVPRLGLGLYNVACHPVATAEGLGHAITHPIATGEAIVDAAVNADPHAAMEFTGETAGLWGAGAALGSLRAARTASVWDLGPAPRGEAIEKMLGQNLPRTFPTVDRFERGIATSIKSVDVRLPSYRDPLKLERTLRRYIDKAAGFSGGQVTDVRILPEQIIGRGLDIAVPGGGLSAGQETALRQVIRYGRKRDVVVRVIEVE